MRRTPIKGTPCDVVHDDYGRVWAYCRHCAGYSLVVDSLELQRLASTAYGLLRLAAQLPWFILGCLRFSEQHHVCYLIYKERKW